MAWDQTRGGRRPSITVGPALVRQELDEPEPGTALLAGADLDLVGEGADDLDSETALLELALVAVLLVEQLEAGTLVAYLDHEPVGLQLIDDLDVALAAVLVGVAHRVRAGLGQRELQVVERLVRDRAHTGDGRQGQPPERDVLGLRRDGQPHRAACLVHRAPSTPAWPGVTG